MTSATSAAMLRQERELHIQDICEAHTTRVVVCTPSKIVLELHSFSDELLHQLTAYSYEYQPHWLDGTCFLHVKL
jgi:hypothetical protein